MPKPNGPRSRWVQIEAAKHITPDSIRRRIAHAEQEIRDLAGLSLGRDVQMALAAHRELIGVLSQRLARAEKQSP